MKKVFVLVFVIIIVVMMGAIVYGDDVDGKPDVLIATAEPTPIGIFDSPIEAIDVSKPIFNSPIVTPEPTPYTPPTFWQLWEYPVDMLRWSK